MLIKLFFLILIIFSKFILIMKLIRITSNHPRGHFENLFNTDIVIKEGSEICLKNATFSTIPDTFTIDGNNNEIKFKFTQTGTEIVALLTEREYTQSNFETLFTDMTTQLNNNLTLTGKQIGVQFKVHDNTEGKFVLKYNISPFVLDQHYFKNKGNNITITSTGINNIQLRSNQANITDDSSILYSVKPFIKGCGVMRCVLERFNDTGSDENGFYMGMTRIKPTEWDEPTLSALDKDLFIRARRDGANGGTYEVQYLDNTLSPVDVDSGIAPAVGDIIEIARVGGNLQVGKYTAGVYSLIHTVNDKNTDLYYPYFICRTNGNDLRLKNCRVQLNPEFLDKNRVLLQDGEFSSEETLGAVPRPQPQLKTQNTLTFSNLNLMEFLGFDISDATLTRTLKAVEPIFKGDNLFDFSIFNDTYLVVLENLDLKSYDGFDGVSRSILDVIPATDNNGNQVIEYEPNTLNFIDLRSKKLNLRNIRGRLLKSDLTEPNLRGLLNITLLIKEN